MTTIADAARKITELPGTLWTNYNEALTSATSYAIDLGVDAGTQSGGQAPDFEIDDETLHHIVEAARMASERGDA